MAEAILIAKQLLTGVSDRRCRVTFIASLWVTRVSQPWAFFGMPTRIWEFALGGMAALTLHRSARIERSPRHIWLQLAGLVAVGFATVSYSQATAYPGTSGARADTRRRGAGRWAAIALR